MTVTDWRFLGQLTRRRKVRPTWLGLIFVTGRFVDHGWLVSLAQVLPCMHVLGKLEKIIDPQRKAHA